MSVAMTLGLLSALVTRIQLFFRSVWLKDYFTFFFFTVDLISCFGAHMAFVPTWAFRCGKLSFLGHEKVISSPGVIHAFPWTYSLIRHGLVSLMSSLGRIHEGFLVQISIESAVFDGGIILQLFTDEARSPDSPSVVWAIFRLYCFVLVLFSEFLYSQESLVDQVWLSCYSLSG